MNLSFLSFHFNSYMITIPNRLYLMPAFKRREKMGEIKKTQGLQMRKLWVTKLRWW